MSKCTLVFYNSTSTLVTVVLVGCLSWIRDVDCWA